MELIDKTLVILAPEPNNALHIAVFLTIQKLKEN